VDSNGNGLICDQPTGKGSCADDNYAVTGISIQ
jgi:hypothetical protein